MGGVTHIPFAAGILLEDVGLSYGRRRIVEHLQGRFPPGTLNAIVGGNGSGKTTLLKTIVGLLKPAQGAIRFEGITQRQLGYLPQVSGLQRDFPFTVREVASMGLWRLTGSFRAVNGALSEKIGGALAQAGLAGMERRPLIELSAGQLQRALFARLILQDSPIVLLDEPFNAVDAATSAQLLELIERWAAEGRTVLCVLHDPAHIARFPRRLHLSSGHAVWEQG